MPPPPDTAAAPPSQRWSASRWRAAPQVDRLPPPSRGRPGPWHLLLFLLTVATTTVAGVGLSHRPAPLPIHVAFMLLRHEPARVMDGIVFSAPLLCTLFAHEMGHYLLARLWHVRTSWPVFVPIPLGLGTLGAMIGMDAEDPRRSRRALLEIGAAGPLVGFVVAFVFLLLGMRFSIIKTTQEMDMIVRLGGWDMPESGALAAARYLVWGALAPERHVLLHPMALAGWYGMYLTWFNLLPFGTLDGGHICHALWPRRSRVLSAAVMAAFAALAAVTRHWSWLAVGAGLVLLGGLGGFGSREEPPGPPPGLRQRWVAVACLLVFLMCVVADPLPRAG